VSREASASPALSATRIVARGLLLPALAGAACVFAFAPFYAWPLAPLALAVVFYAWARSGSALQAALSGFAFGLGFFLAGVSWVFVSLHYFGAMPVVLAAIATFLFCAFLALFPAFAGYAAVRLGGVSASRRLLAAAPAFVALEWLRGTIFTGFPWLTLGTSQAPSSPLAGYAPLLGAYGTSLAVGLCAAALSAITLSVAWSRTRVALLAAIGALFVAGALSRAIPWTQASGPAVSMALLQGNVPQNMKWRDEVRMRTLLDYRRLIFASQAKVVVLPETALPMFLDQLPAEYVESLREHARRTGKEILMGTVERESRGAESDYYNSVVRIDTDSVPAYRKRHLVPFGEFIPWGFKWVLAILQIPLSDFARGPAHQPPIVAGNMRFGVAICYEDVFGEEVIDALPAAEVLLNVSNDAWFGESFAAEQHLQASQMRAVETGRWMVRSTNTGATAVIDERGHVVARLPMFTAGSLGASVVPRKGSTPYMWWGNWAALAIAAALLAAARWARR
jgi:apolipoprotein N-acyltransferase